MKLNKNTALLSSPTLLVPYSPHHVPRYHTWMQSPTLRALTASDPLTLDEEYAMQRSWRSDGDKLTFIICTAEDGAEGDGETGVIKAGGGEEGMVGDVNLFLTESEEEGDEYADAQAAGEEFSYEHVTPWNPETSPPNTTYLVAELEIMIASPSHRGKGLARSALLAFLAYISSHLDAILAEYAAANALDETIREAEGEEVGGGKGGIRVVYLRSKIDKENQASIRLFQSVGFRLVSEHANYFGEVEMRCRVEGVRETVRGVGVEVLRYEEEGGVIS